MGIYMEFSCQTSDSQAELSALETSCLNQIRELFGSARGSLADRISRGARYFLITHHGGEARVRKILGTPEFKGRKARTLRLYGEHAYHYALLVKNQECELNPTKEPVLFSRQELIRDQAFLKKLGENSKSITQSLAARAIFCDIQLRQTVRKYLPHPSKPPKASSPADNLLRSVKKLLRDVEQVQPAEARDKCLRSLHKLWKTLAQPSRHQNTP